MDSQQLTPEQMISYLEKADLPPGTMVLAVIIPPKGATIPDPADFVARQKNKNYRRFVKAAIAVEEMETEVRADRLRELARQATFGGVVGFKRDYHFKDIANTGAQKARWVFHPERCDKFFTGDPDRRLRPARRRKAM